MHYFFLLFSCNSILLQHQAEESTGMGRTLEWTLVKVFSPF